MSHVSPEQSPEAGPAESHARRPFKCWTCSNHCARIAHSSAHTGPASTVATSINTPNFQLDRRSSTTTAHFHRAQNTLSPRALEKQAVRDDDYNDLLGNPVGSGIFGDAGEFTAVPTVPPATLLSARAAPANLPPRPQPRYRRSFLETFLARQQSKEAAGVNPGANTSRLLNPINHLPRPTPVHFPEPARADEPAGVEQRTLLTLPEQRRSRQNSPNSPNFQDSFAPDPENSHRTSIGLPSNHRTSAHSFDLTRRASMSQEKPLPTSPPASKPPTRQNTQERVLTEPNLQTKLASNYGFSEQDQPLHPPRRVASQRSLHRGLSVNSLRSSQLARADSSQVPPLPNASLPQSQSQSQQVTPTRSQPRASSTNHDLERGPDSNPEEPPFDEEPTWGPSHPCYPHLNPHVPIHSAEYSATRIIRIRRDWMIVGDLAPTFSNIYPEILDPLLPEQEFRYIIQHINNTLTRAYNPFSFSNWVDGTLGFLTGWFWEDLRSGGVKGQLKKLEAWIEEWNRTVGASDGVKLISLRRTGYLCLDIQIPDPQVRVIGTDGDRTPDDGESSGTPLPPGTGATSR